MSQTPTPPNTPLDPQTQALHDALWHSRVTQIVLIVLLVGLAGVFAYSLTAKGSIPIDQSAVLNRAKERLAANSSEIFTEVSNLASDIAPPLATSITRQAREDLPLYARALKSQSDELVAGLETQLRKQVNAQTDDFVNKHRQVLREEFPQITDEETVDRILRDYKRTANQLLERYYLDDFRREAKRTAKTWESFEPVKPPRTGTLQDELLEYVGDWLALRAKDAVTDAVQPERPSGGQE